MAIIHALALKDKEIEKLLAAWLAMQINKEVPERTKIIQISKGKTAKSINNMLEFKYY